MMPPSGQRRFTRHAAPSTRRASSASTSRSSGVPLEPSSPRVSFAWTPFKSGSTTVRGGFGVFNDWFEDSLYEQALRLDGERQYDLIVRNPTYPVVDVNAGTRLPRMSPE